MKPASPYAEAKKSLEQLVILYHDTTDPTLLRKDSIGKTRYKLFYNMPFTGFPVMVPRLVNVIGPGQDDRKMLPRIIRQVLESMEREEIQEDDKPYTVNGPAIIHSYIPV